MIYFHRVRCHLNFQQREEGTKVPQIRAQLFHTLRHGPARVETQTPILPSSASEYLNWQFFQA